MHIKDKLNSYSFVEFCRSKSIELAVLFGSRALGQARQDSDWDIAFLLKKDCLPRSGIEVNRLKRELIKDLSAFLETSKIDLVLLNHVSPLLRFQVARTGCPVYQEYPGRFADFASLALRQNEDYKLILQKSYY
ncbi:MAG: nucleotidyltransferase domain-containing protein [Clostridiales bacterium]|nr:nucleotidyltransferase domain-containing protein [Clostridiales bacterium]MCF8021762.1 nucleotidyltransferase domain-containing protein [Clostridiales bacterium]